MEVDQVSEDEVQRWNGLRNVYMRESPFTLKTYAPSPIVALNIQEAMNILVVGAGGLGCEILKLLALSGFTSITVIDLDTVDISNLNRQFLFRRQHVGQPKAKVAAEHIKRKYPHVNVEYETKPLETFPLSFYSQFNLVIAGLDNVKARQNLNRILNDMVKFKADGTPDWSTVIPLIDGGTEGLRGQARLFLPKITSCFECSLQTLVVDENKPELSCTLATVPRNASHCIQYVKEELWDYLEEFKSASEYKMYLKKHPNDEYKPKAVALDKDDPQHLQWICNLAAERAAQFKIEGVTFKLTMQVVKNIIPAVASTNAIIAAACVAEAIKVLTGAAPLLDNYMFFNGIDLPGCSLYSYEKIPTCEVCQRPLVLKLSRSTTVADLQTRIQEELKLEVKPDLSAEEKLLYLSSQHSAFADNLTQTLHALFPDKAPISVIATFYKRTRRVLVYLE